LSSKGFGNIVWSNYEQDFEFEVCDEHYFCPSFVAEFLSPHISKVRRSDCTLRKFVFSTHNSSNCFSKFLSLGFGNSVLFTSDEYSIVELLCLELANVEIYEQLSTIVEVSLTAENVISRLKTFELIGSSSEREIEFVASHLMSIDLSSLFELNDSLLSQIFEHPSLRLQSEDWLYERIVEEISTDCKHFWLLEFVGYEYLSKSSIESFFDLISKSFYFLTPSIWNSLRSRFLSGSSILSSPRIPEQHFIFRSDSPFDGLISFLTQQHHGNVHDHGIVSVTSSNVYSDRIAKHVVDFKSSLYCQTANARNSWICYNLKDKRMNVSHYSLRSRPDYDGYHPMNWMLEGSMDGQNWIELDRRDNCRELVGLNRSATFSVSRRAFFQQIRLRQHGKDSNGYDFLTVNAFELFGDLHDN
jgi:hypothetical protein